MSVILQRHVVWDVPSLCRWLRTAVEADWCVYHSGNLAYDRARDTALNALSDLVLLLSETDYLRTTQRRQFLFITDVWVYVAHRTGYGHAPKSLLTGKLTAPEFRALRAVRDRDADISASRAIRDALSASMTSSDDLAGAMFERLKERKWVTEAKGKGWELSADGLRIIT